MFTDMQLVFFILGITVVCFLVPRFRSDLVALSSLLALFLTGVLTVEETFQGFASSVVIMIASLFVIGEGVFQTGLAERAGDFMAKHTENSEFKMTILMMLLVATLSGFMSNTGTIVILLPMIVSLCRKTRIHPGRLLMPLAYISNIGGSLTLIGTAPNLIASRSLQDHGYEPLSFLSFTAIGATVLVVGMIYLWYIGRRMLFKPIKKDSDSRKGEEEDLLKQYQVHHYIHKIQIPEGFNESRQALKELKWASLYHITVLQGEKERHQRRLSMQSPPPSFSVGADYVPDPGDTLIIYAVDDDLNQLIDETGIRLINEYSDAEYTLDETRLAEVIFTPQSKFINQSLKKIQFRDKYDLSILALKHQYGKPQRPDPEEKLIFGDTLLVFGEWKDINLLFEEKEDTVVLSHAGNPPKRDPHPLRSLLAGAMLIGMIVMMVLEILPAVITAVIVALAMILTRCIRQTEQAYRAVNWRTIVLIASMLPMATALEKTGGSEVVSGELISTFGSIGPMAVMAGIYAIASIISQCISNTATAVLLYPVAILTAQNMGVSPYPMVMAVAFAASMAFATPLATPPNAMVMAAGKYKFLDFVKVGAPLQILIGVCIILLLPLFFPF